MSQSEASEPMFTPVDEEREQQAEAAMQDMVDEEQAETQDSETTERESLPVFERGDCEQMLSFGLGAVEMTIGQVFDVPFEIDELAGNKWIKGATPMLEKYAPKGFAFCARYHAELQFTFATVTLVGGCAAQVRQLKRAQAEAQQEAPTHETADATEQEQQAVT